MFGDQPALTPPNWFINGCLGEIRSRLPGSTKSSEGEPLLAYCEEVLVEGLKLAQVDAEQGVLDDYVCWQSAMHGLKSWTTLARIGIIPTQLLQ